MRTPVGLGQQGCKASKGGAKKSNSEIWHNFQGFSFFEVKLKLIIQCPYRRKWHFWVLISKIFEIWYGKLRESDAKAFTKSLFIKVFLPEQQ